MSNHRIIMSIGGLLFALLAIGCAPLTLTLDTDGPRGLDAKTVYEDDSRTRNRIAIIDITGMMVNGSQSQLLGKGEHQVSLLHEKLEKARTDSSVKAVILRLNTPGGTVTASDMMYREILRFKQKSGKPVITLMMDMATSGGYYVACATDHLIAYPSTVTGSIGVILQTVSFKPMMDKLGIDAEPLTSGPNKSAGSPFEQLEDEHRQILQSMVDDFYKNFVQIVRQSRTKIPADQFDKVVDGRVVSASEAKELGLIDQIGDIYDAWDVAKQRAGIEHAHLVMYHRPLAVPASPYAASRSGAPNAGPTQINLAQFNFTDLLLPSRPGFYYLWTPKY